MHERTLKWGFFSLYVFQAHIVVERNMKEREKHHTTCSQKRTEQMMCICVTAMTNYWDEYRRMREFRIDLIR